MAMSLGAATVTIDVRGNITVTGTGCMKDIFDVSAASGGSLRATVEQLKPLFAAHPDVFPPDKVLSTYASLPAGYMPLYRDIAAGILAHIQANATAHIPTTVSLGVTPNPNNPNTAILPPAAAVDLPIT